MLANHTGSIGIRENRREQLPDDREYFAIANASLGFEKRGKREVLGAPM
jgi:hypothetical protein